MKNRNFIQELKKSGVKVEDRTNHLRLSYNGKFVYCPRHPSQEISDNFAKRIKKTLGLL